MSLNSDDDPLHLIEFWTYPDEATMGWARQIINVAAPLLSQFNISTTGHQLKLLDGFDISEDN